MALRGFARLIVALTVSWTMAPAAGADDEQPAIDRCREFCERIYDHQGEAYDECARACSEADGCHRGCKEKFGDDRPKVQQCLRVCMRRGDDGDRPVEKPVKL